MEVVPSVPLAIALALPFLVTLVALHFILFKPLLSYLSAREHAIEGARHETEQLSTQIDARMADVQARLAKAREEVAIARADARARAAEKQSEILADARKQAEERTKQALDDLQQDQKRASATLRDTANTLSSEIATRVLGRPVAQEARP